MWWILYLISIILSYGLGLHQMNGNYSFDGEFEDFSILIIVSLFGPFSLLVWVLVSLHDEDIGFDWY